jgi:hypothetical protein
MATPGALVLRQLRVAGGAVIVDVRSLVVGLGPLVQTMRRPADESAGALQTRRGLEPRIGVDALVRVQQTLRVGERVMQPVAQPLDLLARQRPRVTPLAVLRGLRQRRHCARRVSVLQALVSTRRELPRLDPEAPTTLQHAGLHQRFKPHTHAARTPRARRDVQVLLPRGRVLTPVIARYVLAMPVIESLLLGKSFDIAFDAAGGAVKAFFKQDSVGRLLVLLHADFGAESDLERDVFYSWRDKQPLVDALGEVLSGARGAEPEQLATLAALIEPRLVRTPEPERAALAARIANAAVRAAPLTVGGEDTLLLVNRLESGQQRIAEALDASNSESTPGLAAALIVGPLRHVGAVEELTAAERRAESGEPAEAAGEMLVIVERLQRDGLRSAAETLGERAATLLASAGEQGRAVEILIAVVRARVARGERWSAEQALTLIESLQGDEEWIAPGLRAQITWPEHGEGDLPALAAAAEGSAVREDHADWLAAHTGLLLLFDRFQEVIAASAALAGSAPLASGGRLAMELDRLDALEALGSEREAQERWLALLR